VAITSEDLTFSIGNVNNKLTKKGLVIDETTNEKLKEVLNNLLDKIHKNREYFFP